ncbi:uncharacterized protein CC84DRAFT_211132 [Paraphaeosphaeria sporulosa]|uniref:Uncharacterized protein n=1 Tax=Paraphaeosphaeria sporulosa TaxID=1460663 RepID=A0A177C1Z9_9PLEO|nr:uncharacterized protein CC84DRAFT_211132 [Paraphaeosphaeria sporulosa]OAG01683.1 hypothetical protein CC84DRAFT_211132 [Paraphaeosphaeria sporulosa]
MRRMWECVFFLQTWCPGTPISRSSHGCGFRKNAPHAAELMAFFWSQEEALHNFFRSNSMLAGEQLTRVSPGHFKSSDTPYWSNWGIAVFPRSRLIPLTVSYFSPRDRGKRRCEGPNLVRRKGCLYPRRSARASPDDGPRVGATAQGSAAMNNIITTPDSRPRDCNKTHIHCTTGLIPIQ